MDEAYNYRAPQYVDFASALNDNEDNDFFGQLQFRYEALLPFPLKFLYFNAYFLEFVTDIPSVVKIL